VRPFAGKAILDSTGRTGGRDMSAEKLENDAKRVDFPMSLWKCVGCSGKLQPVFLEKYGSGPNATIVCRCQKCQRILQKTTEIAIQCLYSKRLKPEQGELSELAVRSGMCDARPLPTVVYERVED
jgi:hypothetical protein